MYSCVFWDVPDVVVIWDAVDTCHSQGMYWLVWRLSWCVWPASYADDSAGSYGRSLWAECQATCYSTNIHCRVYAVSVPLTVLCTIRLYEHFGVDDDVRRPLKPVCGASCVRPYSVRGIQADSLCDESMMTNTADTLSQTVATRITLIWLFL